MSWTWDPGIPLANDAAVYRVTASDAESATDGCALAKALKARPRTWPDTGQWRYRRNDLSFALGPFTKAIEQIHRDCARGDDIDEALRRAQRGLGPIHPGLRRFLEIALDHYVDYHDAREHEIGPLRYIGLFNEIDLKPGSSIMAWGPLYETDNGIREIRRLRFDTAKPTPTLWTDYAAHVAARLDTGRPVRQVFVTEVGLRDGGERHVVPGITPDEAHVQFERSGRAIALAIVSGTSRTAGNECESCKFGGGCPDLVPVPGALQLDRPAAWTRSVSAHDLALYARCPSRWYMQRLANLPRDAEEGDALRRGTAIHAWIETAHQRNVPCTPDDLPDPNQGLGLAEGLLTEEAYRLARPFLLHHVNACPFASGRVEVVLAECSIHGRDAQADVVVVAKPDLVIRRDDTLVVREIKTTGLTVPDNSAAAADLHLAVAFDLAILAHGLAQHHHCTRGEVELEILTPHGATVFTYATDDPSTMATARQQLKDLAIRWANDTTWTTNPDNHCTWCPVRTWCPDRDRTATRLTAATRVDEDRPPF